MKKLYFLFCILSITLNAQVNPWEFYPIQTTGKFWDDPNTQWILQDPGSSRCEYTYANGKIDYMITKLWDGSNFIINTNCVKVEYYYSGNNIDYTLIKFWDGTNYVLNSYSTKTEYTYSGNLIDYTIVKYWDGSNWIIGYQYIAQMSVKTEYTYSGGNLVYTTSKYYDGSVWYIGYQYSCCMSRKTEYTYVAGKLDNTITKFWDGTQWYIGYQYICCVSIRTDYSYNGNALDNTITKYWDGSVWYVGWQYNCCVSIKTEYSVFVLGEKENEKDQGLSIYPNPSNGKVNCNLMEGQGELDVYNTEGKKILHSTLEKGHGEVNTTGYTKGIYLFSVTKAGGQKINRKIMVD
jgi:hypothetical protein